jgi:dihydroneopterin aldolase
VIGVIELRGLRVSGLVGALPEERQRRQPLEIDLDVAADLAEAAAGDRLDDTIDYGELCQRLDDVVAGETFTLLERLASRLAEVVLADPRVESVTITVRKLRPPVPQQLDTAGVRLTVTR